MEHSHWGFHGAKMKMDKSFGWPRKYLTNAYGMPVKLSKCGLAQVVKISKEGSEVSEFLPILSGEVLPRYYRWGDAVKALEAALAGEDLPKVKKPRVHQVQDTYDPETEGYGSEESWKATFNVKVGKDPEPCPFASLGLPTDASFADVKKAYRKYQLQCHPDRGGDKSRFTEITEAYEKIQSAQAA